MTFTFNVLVLGILVSIIFYEITHISPGGIIVPGLLTMYINQPQRIVYTIIVAIITYFIVKLISRYVIVFGKRRFVLMIIISIVINIILELLISGISLHLISISIIGYTIGGIIANDISKQGLKRTIPSLVIVMCIIELIVLISNAIGA